MEQTTLAELAEVCMSYRRESGGSCRCRMEDGKVQSLVLGSRHRWAFGDFNAVRNVYLFLYSMLPECFRKSFIECCLFSNNIFSFVSGFLEIWVLD